MEKKSSLNDWDVVTLQQITVFFYCKFVCLVICMSHLTYFFVLLFPILLINVILNCLFYCCFCGDNSKTNNTLCKLMVIQIKNSSTHCKRGCQEACFFFYFCGLLKMKCYTLGQWNKLMQCCVLYLYGEAVQQIGYP